MRFTLWLLSLTAVCSAGVGALAADAARDREIVVGMSAAFSGPSRGLGIELYRGSMAFFEHLNRTGGVHGRKVRLLAYDDGYDPAGAVKNTVRFVEQDRVLLLYGYVGTPTVTRVLPLLKRYEDSGVMLFFPFTGAEPQRRPPYDAFVFNLRASYAEETGGLVDNFFREGKRRIALFYQIDAYGRSGWAGVKAALGRHGLKMVAEATYRRGTTFAESMRPQVDLLKSADPDAVICVGAYQACAAFIRDARDAGLRVPIANVSFVGSENLLSLVVELGRQTGRDYTERLINSQVVPNYESPDLPAVREYRDLMDRYRPAPPPCAAESDYQPQRYSFVSLEGFLDAKLLAEVLRRAGPAPERSGLRNAAESIDDFDLGIGPHVRFGRRRHQGIDAVYYTGIRDGHFLPLAGWKGGPP